ncbi:MAG TPA: endolytic transglycosylase MltG [Steroidobacteraceae bacterium]|nr:endolytic transglycosylase MltG [Steroidobacteraceae bacterium]
MRRSVWILLALVVVIGGAALGGRQWLASEFEAPGPAAQAVRVTVVPGLTVRGVLGRLQSVGALRCAWCTQLYLRLTGRRLLIKAGDYEVEAHASASDVVEMLEAGRVILEQLTVIEGTRFSDLRMQLATDPHVHSLLKGRSDAEVMAAIGHAGEAAEGRFFPDTYRFAAGTTDVEILRLAYDSMRENLAQAWSMRAADLPLKSPEQALVLASMVEKETGLPSERPRIAGVFVERLRKGMRLQSDPTVIYGLGAAYDGHIHERDLTTDTPFNTYTREGLPPTPIALPGRAALLAAVRPEETGDLYFVATGDGQGGHRFSATLAEHNLAVQHYVHKLRSEAGRQ